MSDPTDILNFTFDAEFEPAKAPLLPEGKIAAILENFEPTMVFKDKWAKTPVKYQVIDADYLAQVGRDHLILTYDLMVELDESTGHPKAPASPDDETNNNLRRFFKAHEVPTTRPLSECVGKQVTLIMKHKVQKDRTTKEVLTNEDGSPFVRATVVAVGRASEAS